MIVPLFMHGSSNVVSLDYYAKNKIQDYQNVTSIPDKNYKWLNRKLKVISAKSAFQDCKKLISFPDFNFDMSKCSNTENMFYDYESLNNLDVSRWDTSNITDMYCMFHTCSSLTTIIGTIDMSSCTDCKAMFQYSDKLRGVHLKNVPRSLDMSQIGANEGETYIIDNYID